MVLYVSHDRLQIARRHGGRRTMCGIFGLAMRSPTERASQEVRRAGGLLAHRGPDQAGILDEPGVLLGIHRLAILDVEGGQQPITTPDGTHSIVYNGELYNHDELRTELRARSHRFTTTTDTETVLHAFAEFGPACLDRFNGMFAIAIWNHRERTLFLARDRLGIKPLYLAEVPQGVAFASEAKALLPLLPDGPQPDWNALAQFFVFGYVPAPAAPFRYVEKFPAGHYAFIRHGDIQLHRYWAPKVGGETADAGPLADEAARVGQSDDGTMLDQSSVAAKRDPVEHLRHLLARCVGKELMSDVPLGVLLSGGLDSSGVAVFARQAAGEAIPSFALRFEETTHDESADARQVAAALGLEHHEYRYSPADLHAAFTAVGERLDEPFGDSTVLPLYTLARFARERVRVALTGWGGDELFAGYPTCTAHRYARFYRALPSLLRDRLIPACARRLPPSEGYMGLAFKAQRFVRGASESAELQHFRWMGYFAPEQLAELFTEQVRAQCDAEPRDAIGASTDPMAAVDRVAAELTETHRLDRILNLDLRFFLEGNGLFQADRMTMAASLEARVPLLNRELLDYVLPLPLRTKLPGGRLKGLLKEALRPYLPDAILRKPKKGFGPPTSTWLRGPLRETMRAVLDRDRLTAAGALEPGFVERLMNDHLARRADFGRELWAMMSFQTWYERWITNWTPPAAATDDMEYTEEPLAVAAAR
jgi:asparagine synthase (glutamine-hydrolysing)